MGSNGSVARTTQAVDPSHPPKYTLAPEVSQNIRTVTGVINGEIDVESLSKSPYKHKRASLSADTESKNLGKQWIWIYIPSNNVSSPYDYFHHWLTDNYC